MQRASLDDLDASPRPRGGTLPYREATALLDCIRIMGEQNAAYCRQEVLGEAPPQPIQPTHHLVSGITTPQPINVQLNPNGTTNFQVNGANVVFNPDAQSTDQAMANRAETKFNLIYGAINWQDQSGSITSFTGPGAPQVTIRTTYGPGVSRTSPSGYGRGTTAADIAAKAISLGFHEGRHGLDFIEFLQQNPVPLFLGGVGITVTAFQTAITAYHTALNQYRGQMDRFSTDRTDCVGRTIDQHNLSNGFVTTICQQVPAVSGGSIP
ncbi:MAG: hypothetical protein R3B95_14700 [Nitrospirales bacterium]|nr:hypothetical protein [Nitrospirales bacterium]